MTSISHAPPSQIAQCITEQGQGHPSHVTGGETEAQSKPETRPRSAAELGTEPWSPESQSSTAPTWPCCHSCRAIESPRTPFTEHPYRGSGAGSGNIIWIHQCSHPPGEGGRYDPRFTDQGQRGEVSCQRSHRELVTRTQASCTPVLCSAHYYPTSFWTMSGSL